MILSEATNTEVLQHDTFLDLPAHCRAGGFDHAAVHNRSHRLYLAHTANNSIDIVDTRNKKYLSSIVGLDRVAGMLVAGRDA